MHATLSRLEQTDFPALRRNVLETVQINLGYLCNLSCLHCHVNAGPTRKEIMSRETIDTILQYLKVCGAKTVDLTGGAPEMNPDFRYFVKAARDLGLAVIDRCNLTILSEPGYAGTAEFLANNKVTVVALLPCYLEDNVDAQRGEGVFDGSIKGLQELNALGYGKANSGLTLDLVYNPQGATLPPPQKELEANYHHHLFEHFGIIFNQLYTVANMPIKRFGSMLISKGTFDGYMDLLRSAHNVGNLSSVMCKSLISIDWQGYVYDCDFNQMLGLPLTNGQQRTHITDLMNVDLNGRNVVVKDHCYGCTAGQGSSCGGALDAA
ncbi:MAG: arsenosugar biosynthesis radical SAM protein ArsS [Gammaproteobacteria bacterium]|nr:arsenosugar biosynthesis radical SAM protein ArsS [Gammaproteobacteria bacterium]